MFFGKWLKEKRAAAGLTQLQLVKAAGDPCTDANISGYENKRYIGKSGNPTRPKEPVVEALAIALADALHLPREEMIKEARDAAGYNTDGKPYVPDGFDESDFARLYFKHTKLTPARQREFKRVLAMVDNDLDRELLEMTREQE